MGYNSVVDIIRLS